MKKYYFFLLAINYLYAMENSDQGSQKQAESIVQNVLGISSSEQTKNNPSDSWVITIHDDPVAPYVKKTAHRNLDTIDKRTNWRTTVRQQINRAAAQSDPAELTQILNNTIMTGLQELEQDIQTGHLTINKQTIIHAGITVALGAANLALLSYLTHATGN